MIRETHLAAGGPLPPPAGAHPRSAPPGGGRAAARSHPLKNVVCQEIARCARGRICHDRRHKSRCMCSSDDTKSEFPWPAGRHRAQTEWWAAGSCSSQHAMCHHSTATAPPAPPAAGAPRGGQSIHVCSRRRPSGRSRQPPLAPSPAAPLGHLWRWMAWGVGGGGGTGVCVRASNVQHHARAPRQGSTPLVTTRGWPCAPNAPRNSMPHMLDLMINA